MRRAAGLIVLAATIVAGIMSVGLVTSALIVATVIAVCLFLTAELMQIASIQDIEIHAINTIAALVISVFLCSVLSAPLWFALLPGFAVPLGVYLIVQWMLPPKIVIFKSEKGVPVFRRCLKHVELIENWESLQKADFLGIDNFDHLTIEEQQLLSKALRDNVPARNPEWIYERLFGIVSTDLINSFGNRDLNRSLLYKTCTQAINPAVALVVLILISPVFILTALVIYLHSGQSPFFSQERLGLNNKPFRIQKFTTMRAVEDRYGSTKEITAIGKFLRRWKLDELPQLYNVMIGEMTFIGPRPEWTNILNADESVPANYNLRHLVKPGITGWAQVNYRYTSTQKMRFRKMQLDLYYIKHGGIAMDLLILLRTFYSLLRPPTAL